MSETASEHWRARVALPGKQALQIFSAGGLQSAQMRDTTRVRIECDHYECVSENIMIEDGSSTIIRFYIRYSSGRKSSTVDTQSQALQQAFYDLKNYRDPVEPQAVIRVTQGREEEVLSGLALTDAIGRWRKENPNA